MAASRIKLAVFWDLENIHVPRGSNARVMTETIRQKAFPKHGYDELVFEAFLDVTLLPKEVQIDLERANVKLVHVPTGTKNGADLRIVQAANDFVHQHVGQHVVIILLSSDENFLPLALSLRRNSLVDTCLIHAKHANEALVAAFDRAFEWPALTPRKMDSSKTDTKKQVFDGQGSKTESKGNPAPGTSKTLPAKSQTDSFVKQSAAANQKANSKTAHADPKQADPKIARNAKEKPVADVEPRIARNAKEKSADSTSTRNRTTRNGTSRKRSDLKKLSCSRCDKEFTSEEALKQHQEATNHYDVFSCAECEKDFTSEKALEQHQNSTGHSDVFVCFECEKEFTSEEALDQHQNATGHSDGFQCLECEKEFTSEEALRQHQAATGHSDVFVCSQCDKEFESEKALEQHQSATGHVDVVICLGCNKEFTSDESLEQHQNATGHYNRRRGL